MLDVRGNGSGDMLQLGRSLPVWRARRVWQPLCIADRDGRLRDSLKRSRGLLLQRCSQACAGPTARDGETPSITRSPRAERRRRRHWRHDAAGTEAPGAVGDAPQLPRYARRARRFGV